MKINRSHVQGAIAGALVGAALLISPIATFAARTGMIALSGLTFANQSLQVNLPAPVLSINAATTTYGSVSNGTIAFAVTGLDGNGETIPSSALATSTALNGAGYTLTWPAVQGAISYRVYFSTSTSPSTQTFVQYFNATTTGQFTFLSTSSPVFISTGISASNTAYVTSLPLAGNAWINSGKIAIGTTTQSISQVTIASSTAPQLSITDVGSSGWAFRALSGTISIASTTPTGVTSGPAALSMTTNGYVSFGTTTTAGNLNLSTSGSSQGSTTINGGRLQFDVANAQGAHSCVMLNGTAWIVNPGTCTR